MMTQRDRLVALLTEFGITPSFDLMESYGGEWGHNEDGSVNYDMRIGGQRAEKVILEAYEGGVTGYNGFVCQFFFDSAGKFLEVGVWE